MLSQCSFDLAWCRRWAVWILVTVTVVGWSGLVLRLSAGKKKIETLTCHFRACHEIDFRTPVADLDFTMGPSTTVGHDSKRKFYADEEQSYVKPAQKLSGSPTRTHRLGDSSYGL